jgi:hypothetical protein
LCTNSSTGLYYSRNKSNYEVGILYLDKIIDNDDKYDVQSYMRTINTTEIALLDNFK